jgi:hypothetical protein
MPLTEMTMADNEFPPVTPGEMLNEEFLIEYGLSQNQLAKAIGISPNRIAEIVNNRRRIAATPYSITNDVRPPTRSVAPQLPRRSRRSTAIRMLLATAANTVIRNVTAMMTSTLCSPMAFISM